MPRRARFCSAPAACIAGKDPYFVHYYRINLDGSGLTTFTQADANHAVRFSGDGQYYLDRYSRVDLPPVMELRRTSDQKLVMTVEKADASALLATGWRVPEAFVAKGRDGKTDIYGVIVRPTNFDAKKKYPVIEYIYAGPHDSFVPKTWGVQYGMQAQAELGFIVSQIDGMGTSNRSKAFHDVAWQNIGDAGFPDRILLAQGGRREISVVRCVEGRHLRRVGGRPERDGRAALSSGVLQSRRELRRLPRQPHGQDLVERAVDGLAARSRSTTRHRTS